MSNPDSPDVTELERKIREMTTNSKPASEELTKNLASIGAGQRPPLSVRMTTENVREAFTYAAWNQQQVDAGKEVTEALIAAAETILRVVPESPLRTRAINGLFDARMIANAAITHRGKF